MSAYAFQACVWLLALTTVFYAVKSVLGYQLVYRDDYGMSYDLFMWTLRKLSHIAWLGIPFFGCVYLWFVTRRIIRKIRNRRLPVILNRGMITFGRNGRWLLVGLIAVTFLISVVSIASRYRVGWFFIEFRFWNADFLYMPLLFVVVSLCAVRYVMGLYVRSKLIDLQPGRNSTTYIVLLFSALIEVFFLSGSWLGSWSLLMLSVLEILLALQLAPLLRYMAKLNALVESV